MKDLIYGRQRKIKRSYPNQYICEERANGVICNGYYYPYKFSQLTLSPKPGIMRYLKNAIMSYSVSGITPTGYYVIFKLVDGVQYNLAYLRTPELTAADSCFAASVDFAMGILCEERATISLSASSQGNSTTVLYYADIDVLPGDKKPVVIEE